MLQQERYSHLKERICDVYSVSPLKKESSLERTFFSVLNYINL